MARTADHLAILDRPRIGGAAKFLRYLAAGVISFLVDFAIYGALASLAGVAPLIANLVSRPAGGLTCFLINKRWTFVDQGSRPAAVQFFRFWCVFAMSLGLSEALLWLFHHLAGLDSIPAKAAAEAVAVVFNFLLLKHWTFR